MHFLRYSLLSLVLVGGGFSTLASHLRAGEITVERESCTSLSFRITVTVFTNTINTPVLFGGTEDWLDFGDGTRVLVPEQANVLSPESPQSHINAGRNFSRARPCLGTGKVAELARPERFDFFD